MDANIKKKWLAALRSREFKQVMGALKRDEGHCCLGVLCELLEPDALWEKRSTGSYTIRGEGALMPYSLQERLNLSDSEKEPFAQLPKMNDRGKTFEEIADFIEVRL
jgi:hypothetical protein